MAIIGKLEDVILAVLEEHSEARDSDYALYFYVLQQENDHPTESMLDMPLSDALHAMSTGKLTSIMSVARIRRIVQEEASKDPTRMYLCGNRKRKKAQEQKTAEDIINHKINKNHP